MTGVREITVTTTEHDLPKCSVCGPLLEGTDPTDHLGAHMVEATEPTYFERVHYMNAGSPPSSVPPR